MFVSFYYMVVTLIFTLKKVAVPSSSSPRDKIPYDLSISSENNVTKGDSDEDAGAASEKDADSLHDSMEILEEVGDTNGRLLHPCQRDNGNYAPRRTHYAARGLHYAARGLP